MHKEPNQEAQKKRQDQIDQISFNKRVWKQHQFSTLPTETKPLRRGVLGCFDQPLGPRWPGIIAAWRDVPKRRQRRGSNVSSGLNPPCC